MDIMFIKISILIFFWGMVIGFRDNGYKGDGFIVRCWGVVTTGILTLVGAWFVYACIYAVAFLFNLV